LLVHVVTLRILTNHAPHQDLGELIKCNTVTGIGLDLGPELSENRLGQRQLRDVRGGQCTLSLEEDLELILALRLRRQQVQQIGLLLRLHRVVDDADFEHQFMGDWLAEQHAIQTPLCTVRENDPLDTLAGCIGNRLVEMVVVEFRRDSFDFDDDEVLSVPSDNEVREASLDAILTSEIVERIPTKGIADDR